MKLETPKNANYAATVVELKDFALLPNCDNVKAALIFGNSVIVSKDTPAGEIGLFFPAETALSAEFIGANNLYRHAEFGNADKGKTGFFEQHGRVKTMKFRGHKSEGFYIPISSVHFLDDLPTFSVGDSFDHIGTHEICRKYVPRGNRAAGTQQTKGKTAKLEDSIVDGQFRFHFDTENLRRNVHKIQPNDWISISDKWHGTSVVIGKLLVKRELSWYEHVLRKIGVNVNDQTYGLTYSSRRVIKAVKGAAKNQNAHYYSEDIWGVVAKEVEDKIPNGFTLYGEIVGFTPDGSPIQGGYHYGCMPRHHELVVYRVTLTTPDGLTVELSWQQLEEFCTKYGLNKVPDMYVGRACALYPAIYTGDITVWQTAFLSQLEKDFVNDGMCHYNNSQVPAEGIVLRVDHLNECESLKLKNFRFLEHETKLLDKGIVDTETAEAEEAA